MATTWPKRSSTNRKKLIDELLRGRESAAQLQILIHEPFGEHGSSVSAEELIGKISTSFSETLSALSLSESGEVCREGSGENSKRSGLKDRRSGALKRRNSGASETWTMVSPSTEDGHAWRKYGQKEILNSKYPSAVNTDMKCIISNIFPDFDIWSIDRSYFRCRRKFDEGCRATKQVQRINEEEPHVYQTTYIGHHTCNKYALNHSDPEEKTFVNAFDSNGKIPFIKHNDECINLYPSTSSAVKKEQVVSDVSESLSSELLGPVLLPNSAAFESLFAPAMVLPAEMGSDYGHPTSASYSCSAPSYQDLDMNFVVGSVDCDNYFHFDFDDETQLIPLASLDSAE
nr:WRKY [Loropetalum chinense var. rubrum]